jgi:hypothetical protein
MYELYVARYFGLLEQRSQIQVHLTTIERRYVRHYTLMPMSRRDASQRLQRNVHGGDLFSACLPISASASASIPKLQRAHHPIAIKKPKQLQTRVLVQRHPHSILLLL